MGVSAFIKFWGYGFVGEGFGGRSLLNHVLESFFGGRGRGNCGRFQGQCEIGGFRSNPL